MFIEVSKLIDKSNVKYWLDHGTLLGAVRDGHRIPWDFEFDIGMLRDDALQNSELWDQIKTLGYEVIFDGENHIKIVAPLIMDEIYFSGFNIDINLNYIQNGYYVYDTFLIPKNIIVHGILAFHQIVSNLLDSDFKVKYRLITIYKTLLSKIGEDSLIEEVNFIPGKYPQAESFSVQVKDEMISGPFLISPESEFLPWIFWRTMIILFLAPKKLIQMISWLIYPFFIVANNPNNFKLLKQLKFPESNYSELENINFLGVNYKVPKSSKQYLELIYGTNWDKPNPDWEPSV